MTKKKISPWEKFLATWISRKKYTVWGALVLMTSLALGAALGPGRNTIGGKKLHALFATATPTPTPFPSPANPSKEYIYAGGRLIATEESGVNLVAPTGLVATTFSNLVPSTVYVDWTGTHSADHYEVERTTNVNTSYTQIASVHSSFIIDTDVSSVTAYLYRVRAVGASGNVSPYSNIDVATAISFTDDTLQAGSTTVQAAHFNELRQAVNAVRATTANLGQVSWEESIIAATATVPGTTIKASHIVELQTTLYQALSSLNLPACPYTSATAGDPIQKAHVEQLRLCVK